MTAQLETYTDPTSTTRSRSSRVCAECKDLLKGCRNGGYRRLKVQDLKHPDCDLCAFLCRAVSVCSAQLAMAPGGLSPNLGYIPWYGYVLSVAKENYGLRCAKG